MIKILAFQTTANSAIMAEAVKSIHKDSGDVFRFERIYQDRYEDPSVSLEPVKDLIYQSDILLIDIRSDCRVARELPAMLSDYSGTVAVMVAADQSLFALTRMGKFRGDRIFKPGTDKDFNVHIYKKTRRFSEMTKRLGKLLPFGMMKDMRNWVLAQEYYSEGDAGNLKNMLAFLLREYGGLKHVPRPEKPRKALDYGLYYPPEDTLTDDLEEYRKLISYNGNHPTMGVLIYGGMHFYDNRPVVEAVYQRLSERNNLIIVFSKAEHNIEAINHYLRGIDLFLNLQYFRIHGGPFGGEPDPTYKFFKEVDVPYVAAVRTYETERDTWMKSDEGLNPLENILSVVLPELDGSIEPVFTAAVAKSPDDETGEVKWIEPVPDRIEKLCARIEKWIALRKKAPDEKKIAVMVYN